MADFQVVHESITLEEYRRRDAAGEITRPLSWPPIRRRPLVWSPAENDQASFARAVLEAVSDS